jgi:Carboxypeptidase regulatory-like domain
MSASKAVWLRSVYLLALLVTLAAASARAQLSTATIEGTVQDKTGAVVPGASVVATQTETNVTAKAVTGNSGFFSLPDLPLGPYKLEVTTKGFAPFEQTGIVLTVGQVADFTVQLGVAGGVEKVMVTGEPATVEPTESTIQNVVEQAVVVELPLNGRNPANLLETTSGVNNAVLNIPTGQAATVNPYMASDASLPGGSAPFTHGVRGGGTYFALDGASNVDPYNVVGGPFPDPDATQEFSVVTGTYGARYVSAPGGSVNIVTKSGTNAIHGDVFEFIRNGFFNAENERLAQPDTLKRNQYGATIGAPILKDRIFVFGSYQGSRINAPVIGSFILPDANERSGLFYKSCPSYPQIASGCVPLQIPAPLSSSVNINLLKYIPTPTTANQTLTIGTPNPTDEEQYVVKTDFVLGKNRAFARWLYDHFNAPAVPEPTSPPYDVYDTLSGQKLYWDAYAVGDSWISGNWVAQTTVSYLNAYIEDNPATQDSFVNYTALGAVNFAEPALPLIGITVIGSAVTPGADGYEYFPRDSLDGSEDVTYVKGKHQVAFGGDIRHFHFGEYNQAGQSGVIVYPGVWSNIVFGPLNNNAFADFYGGHPVDFIQSDGFFTSANGYLYGFYGEDKFRVTRRLTVTPGIRWDPFLPFTHENNQVTCWNPGEQSSVFPNAPAGLIYPGDANCPATGTPAKYYNFEPRLGMGYQLDKKGDLALRGGYGIYDMQVPLSSFLGFSAFPWVRNYSLANPFQSIGNIWGSNGETNPFLSGFQGYGFVPQKNVAYPATYPTVSASSGLTHFDKNFNSGYVQQWSLSLEEQFGRYDSVEIAYIGTKGTHLSQDYDQNLPCLTDSDGNHPHCIGVVPSTTNTQQRRANWNFGAITDVASVGNSSYNAAEVSFRHRSKAGLGIVSNFSWSHCIDIGSAPGSYILEVDPNDGWYPNMQRGRCDFNQTLTWRTTGTWNTPALEGRNSALRGILGSWVASGIGTVDTGQPFSVTDSAGLSYTGAGIERADEVSGVPLYVHGLLNYAAFTGNAPGTFGTTGRNEFSSKGLDDIDLALMKNFKIHERWGVMFRAESFNLINHVNLYENTANVNSTPSLFDEYQLARAPRQLQFALKVNF